MDNLFPGGDAAFSDFVMNTISPLFTGHYSFSFSESNSNNILVYMESLINFINPLTCKKFTNDFINIISVKKLIMGELKNIIYCLS